MTTLHRLFGPLLLCAVLLIGALFRFQHLDWDRGYLFHPDERQILLVASNIQWPSSVTEFLSPDSSLDPKFFAYGSFPIYLARLVENVAPASTLPSPWQDDRFVAMALAARALSASFDLGSLLLLYILGATLYNATVGLAASAAYAVSVLAVQLSHFYTVDTLLTFFCLATILFCSRFVNDPGLKNLVACGVAFGLALATKVTAVILILPILYAITIGLARGEDGLVQRRPPTARGNLSIAYWRLFSRPLLTVIGVAALVFVAAQPYAVLDAGRYVADITREALIARGWYDYPFTRQYSGTLPFIYPVQQSVVWGLGWLLGLLGWGGAASFVVLWARRRAWQDGLVVLWATAFFLLIAGQQVKYPRYLLPLVPFLFLMAARFLLQVQRDLRDDPPRWGLPSSLPSFLLALGVAGGLIWVIAFNGILGAEHPWLATSDWIYQNVPPGATLLEEEWDDKLPVLMNENGQRRTLTEYHLLQNRIFDPDGSVKLDDLAANLGQADYIILASPRGFGSIPRLSQRYPITSRYYQALFDGRLGYEPVQWIHQVPQLGDLYFMDDPFQGTPILPPASVDLPTTGPDEPGQSIWLGREDESLAVYDHPFVVIFKRLRGVSPEQTVSILSGID